MTIPTMFKNLINNESNIQEVNKILQNNKQFLDLKKNYKEVAYEYTDEVNQLKNNFTPVNTYITSVQNLFNKYNTSTRTRANKWETPLINNQ